MLSTDSQGGDIPTYCPANEQDPLKRNNDSCSLSKSHEKEDLLHSKEQEVVGDELKLHLFLDTIDSCHAEAALSKNFDLLSKNHYFGKKEAAISNGMVENGLASGLIKPIVYRWPSLEKVLTFSSDELDSQSAFVFITPSSCPTYGKTLYFWVGRLLDSNKCKAKLESNQKCGDLVEVDWEQASSDVVSRLGLPKDIKIQVRASHNHSLFLQYMHVHGAASCIIC